MQWHNTYAVEIYAKDRQRELLEMANTAPLEAKAIKKMRRNHLPRLLRRANNAARATFQLKFISDTR